MDFSRNWLFIDAKLQRKLGEIKLLVIGSGIGSRVAEEAVRIGIRHITVADGDTVSASNLNRQNYVYQDIGRNKAIVCAERMLAINPAAEITAIDEFLEEQWLQRLIPEHDFIVNAIDFDAAEFPVCREICKRHKKTEFFPFNLGFASTLTIFMGEGKGAWKDFFSNVDHVSLKYQIVEHVLNSLPPDQAEYMLRKYQIYLNTLNDGSYPGYDPQLSVAGALSAILTVAKIVTILQGEAVRQFPYFYLLDSFCKPIEEIKPLGNRVPIQRSLVDGPMASHLRPGVGDLA